MSVFLAVPFTADAASAHPYGSIVMRDEFGAWGIDNYSEDDIIDCAFFLGEEC